MKIDVRLGNRGLFGDKLPLMRELISFTIKVKKDTGTTSPGVYRWVYWYWKPQNNQGQYDCGFSGIREDHKDFHATIITLETHTAACLTAHAPTTAQH